MANGQDEALMAFMMSFATMYDVLQEEYPDLVETSSIGEGQ